MRILDQEELLWRSKSRQERLGEGDRNTSYFHRSVTIRRATNRIMCLRDEVGNDILEPECIKTHILTFYRNLYSLEQLSCLRRRPEYDDFITKSIKYSSLNKEICCALFDMKPLKAPGSDGFHPIFFLRAWETIGDDIC